MLPESRYSHRDEEDNYFPLADIDKTQTIQEGKALFKKTPVHSMKCSFMLTKLLFLLARGEKFSSTEANDIFFTSLNLFVSKNEKLKRLMFILMKELSPDVEQAFMACNSLFQDMSSNKPTQRAAAIRVLRKITDADASLFGQLDRHLKQSVVDQDPSVSSAALIAGLHLSQANADMVKRWMSEMQAALKSSNHMVQYHALALLYNLRHTDPLAVSRLVSANISSLRSPLAHSMLIRYAATILKEENNRNGERTKEILEYLDSCLTYKNDMIILEACRVLVDLEYLEAKEYTSCVTALQSFLMTSKPVLRFTAARLLSKLADRFPILVSLCNPQLDEIMEDDRCSREVRTLAITTLLKTGSEPMIERLVKQTSRFMSGLSDDYKTTIIEAMKNLVVQYPRHVNAVLSFFSSALRDEGGLPFKMSVAEAIMHLMDSIPECKEQGMTHLCEHIEDCEFPLLLQTIMRYIGEVGPQMPKPARYVRFVYNRVLLESADVRANAVITLANFAAHCPDLRQSIKVIFRRIMHDNDDEVRERAVFYLNVIDSGDEDLIRALILEELPMNVSSLEKTLMNYLQEEKFEQKFDISTVAEQEKEDAKEAERLATLTASASTLVGATDQTGEELPAVGSPFSPTTTAALLSKVPQLAELGEPCKSSAVFPLTDLDDAYVVGCVKHIFPDKIVFQFNCTNKVEGNRLENVVVHMDVDQLQQGAIHEEFAVQVAALPYGASETAFVVMNREGAPVGSIRNTLHFAYREVDPDADEEDLADILEEDAEEDDFDLDELHLRMTDYVRVSKDATTMEAFREAWNEAGSDNELKHSAELPARESLQQVVDRVITINGLVSLNDKTVASGKDSHILFFDVETIVGPEQQPERALLVAKLTQKDNTVVLQTAVRCESPELRNRLVGALVP